MKEERFLSRKFGKGNHFRVPAGYFDSLTQNIMATLPEKARTEPAQRKARNTGLTPLVGKRMAAAACLLAIAGGAILLTRHAGADGAAQPSDMTATYDTQDYTIDQMVDYVALSGDDFYLYLAEE